MLLNCLGGANRCLDIIDREDQNFSILCPGCTQLAQMIPGLLKYGDYSEIGSLIAPRPCVWETGSDDGLIVPRWDDVFRERLLRVYAALGAADQLHFDRFEGGHEWSGRIAFPLFDDVLKPSAQ